MIHVGFYNIALMDGLYEQHGNYFVAADTAKDAKILHLNIRKCILMESRK